MNHDFESTEFSRSILAGVFAGLGATVITLIFNFIFRGYTGFALSQIINVSTIIFMTMILMVVGGVLFYLFHHYVKSGTVIYKVVAVVLTAIFAFLSLNIHRSPDPIISAEFKQFVIGIVLIYGLFLALVIPNLYKSDRV